MNNVSDAILENSIASQKITRLPYLHILANKFGVSELDKSCGRQRSTCLEKIIQNSNLELKYGILYPEHAAA